MILYLNEGTPFRFGNRRQNSRWLRAVASREGKRIGDISIIFCSDSYILQINREFLSHDYFTDVITFDYCERDLLSGDLFISVDTVRENARQYAADFDEELHRVIVHGLLHLIGYGDKTAGERKIMREKEDAYLLLRSHV